MPNKIKNARVYARSLLLSTKIIEADIGIVYAKRVE